MIVFARSCSSQPNDDIEAIGHGKLGVLKKSSNAHVASEFVNPSPN